MAILEKTVRLAAITVAVVFIGLSLFGILGVWSVDHKATEIALKGFGLVETAVGVVDAGVARVDNLIGKSRTEVRQASDTITAVGARAEANSPVLNTLNERLETRLAPCIAQMQQVLAPVRDAVGTIGNVVSLLNSVPGMVDIERLGFNLVEMGIPNFVEPVPKLESHRLSDHFRAAEEARVAVQKSTGELTRLAAQSKSSQ